MYRRESGIRHPTDNRHFYIPNKERTMQRKIDDSEQGTPVENREDQDNGSLTGEAQEAVQQAKQEVAEARRPWFQVVRWGRLLLLFYVIEAALFALLGWWVHYHPVLSIDVTITREFQENHSAWLQFLMNAVSYIGYNFALSIGLILVAALIFWLVDLRLEAILIVANSAVSAGLNGLIKFIVARPRPSAGLVEVLSKAGGQSFPSGHVMAYVAFWGLLFTFGIIIFRGNHWWRIALLIVTAFFVVMVGPSRIYLGDHWASDVLGAYMIGSLLLGITLWIYLHLSQRGVLAPRREYHWVRYRGKLVKQAGPTTGK